MEKRNIIHKIRRESHRQEKVKEVIEYVKASGGIEYATKIMDNYYNEAIDILKDFKDSPYKESLGNLVKFTIERNR